MNFYHSITKLLLLSVVVAFSACSSDDDDEAKPQAPTTYEFNREGVSSISYSGQLARLAQVEEIKAKVATAEGENPQKVTYADLWEMFTNANDAGSSLFESAEAQTAGKQVASKIYQADLTYFEELFKDLETVSGTTERAQSNQAGLSQRSSGKDILLNAKGHEYVQMTEKRLMGSLMYYQMASVYLSDTKTGDAINNTEVIEKSGKKYTALEHGWDEAFGYFGAPVDFPITAGRFWAKYCGTVDAHLGTSSKIMDAFIKGRFAITTNDLATKNEQREVLFTEVERVVAGTAIHYLNSTMEKRTADILENGDYFHALSEAYCFINSLRYSPKAKVTSTEVDSYLSRIEDFWSVSSSTLEEVRNEISAKYGMEAVRGDL